MEPKACVVVKSTVPVVLFDIKTRLGVLFFRVFERKNDNFYPSRIIVGEKSESLQFAI